jgi:uncharacterized protein YprB with RNaseH-like and TPR domain
MINELRCEHRHLRCEHPRCFIKGTGHPIWWKEARIAFFDIETTGLDAQFGTLLGWAVKPLNGKPVAMITDKKHILSADEDKHLLQGLVDELLKHDIIVGYYSTKFDLPFARTRAFIHGLEFPAYGSINHLDLYYVAKSKLKLRRNRLDNVGSVFGLTGKTYLNPSIWRRAGQGNKAALKYILDHNIADVILTEKVYKKMESLFKGGKKSV